MKKLLYLLPLLLGIIACGAQPQSTQNVADMVNATLTAIAQDNPQVIAPQTTFTPSSVQVQPAATQSESTPIGFLYTSREYYLLLATRPARRICLEPGKFPRRCRWFCIGIYGFKSGHCSAPFGWHGG